MGDRRVPTRWVQMEPEPGGGLCRILRGGRHTARVQQRPAGKWWWRQFGVAAELEVLDLGYRSRRGGMGNSHFAICAGAISRGHGMARRWQEAGG